MRDPAQATAMGVRARARVVEKFSLDAEAAAEAVLNRIAFGPRPGEAEQLASGGMVKWVEAQLDGDLAP